MKRTIDYKRWSCPNAGALANDIQSARQAAYKHVGQMRRIATYRTDIAKL